MLSSPTPGTVANLTMESYIQPTSSCMDCHSTARVPNGSIKTNYSFIVVSETTSSGRGQRTEALPVKLYKMELPRDSL
jgi:hypothetical protein